MEDKTVSPGDDGTGKGAMRKTVACDEESGVAREKPNVDEVENGDIVTEVE